MKLEILPTDKENEFIFDLSEISIREKLTVDVTKSIDERIKSISKEVAENLAKRIEIKLKVMMQNSPL